MSIDFRHVSSARLALTIALLAGITVTGCSDGSPSARAGGSLTVGGNQGDFSSLQSAVNAASDGDVITLQSVTLDEQVVVSKSITIVGNGGASLSLSGSPQAFGDDSSDTSSAALIIRDVSGVEIIGLSFTGPQDGIQIRNASDIRIVDVTVTGSGDDGVDVRASTEVSIQGRFESNGDRGIQIREGSSQVTVEDSVLAGNVDDGLRARESSAVTILRTEVSANGGDGIELRDIFGATVADSSMTSNLEYGLRIRSSSDVIRRNNSISGNGQGDVRID